MSEKKIEIGVMGGSGLYDLEGLEKIEAVRPETPFGDPSDEIITGEINGVRVGFLPRHGKGHRLSPSEVPYRANFAALKKLGAHSVLGISAVGSLRKELQPGHAVLIDQIIDRTKGIRKDTFFGEGIVGHVSLADPICAALKNRIYECAEGTVPVVHMNGTYVCIEGPRFSSRAESLWYQSLNTSVIGMTAYPEAALAREAGIHYATLCFVTDYDCWNTEEEGVTVEAVMALLKKNVNYGKDVLKKLFEQYSAGKDWRHGDLECGCEGAGKNAIMTDPNLRPEKRNRILQEVLG